MFGRGIPGSNLLLQALRLIQPTRATYFKYAKKVVGPNRAAQDYFEPGVIIDTGNTQAVSSARKAELGISTDKTTWMWRVNWPVQNVDRGRSPDRVVIHTGAVCDVFAVARWGGLDGWVEVVLVEIAGTIDDIPVLEPTP